MIRDWARRRGFSHADNGFSVLETVVAMGAFLIIAASVLSGLVNTLNVTQDDRNRVRAASLAAREVEIARAAFNSPVIGPKQIQAGQVVNENPLPGGTEGAPLLVDNVPFTVTRTAEWTQQGTAASPCDVAAPNGSTPLAYLRVTAKVTWPQMGNTQPIMSSTLLAPPLGTFAAGTGHLRVTVSNEDGAKVEGQQVDVTGPGGALAQDTSDGGCAFFAALAAGTYTVTVSAPNGIDRETWATTASQTVTVVANAVAQASIAYTTAASVNATLTPSIAGYTPAKNIPLNLANTAFTPSGTKTLTGDGAARSFKAWPFPDGLGMWAGSCKDADPLATGGERDDPVVVDPGGAATVNVPLVPVTVSVARLGVLPVAGVTVYAIHAKDQTTGCSTGVTDPVSGGTVGQVLQLNGVTDSVGQIRASIPYGTWTFKVAGKSPSGGVWPVTNLLASLLAPGVVSVNTL